MTSPLVKRTSETTDTLIDFPPPTWLKHQPVFMLPYASFDGPYAEGTDAKYLSIGLAQWRSDVDPDALSAKVWRYSGEKWSRMSEEIPLHRLADLCTLLVKVLYQVHPTDSVTPIAVVEARTFENQNEKIELRQMNDLPAGFAKENERIKERLRRLRDELTAAQLD